MILSYRQVNGSMLFAYWSVWPWVVFTLTAFAATLSKYQPTNPED